jgi:acyl-CoA synthetase (AMP-forming)/AMP-acid ligase II
MSGRARVAARLLAAVVLVGVALLCGFGFLASFELGFPNVFHALYGAAGVAALVDHVRRELGPIATPAGVEFVEALPKTRSGKILRRYLKARELGTDTGDLSTLDE